MEDKSTIVNDMGNTVVVNGKPKWVWVVQTYIYDYDEGSAWDKIDIFSSREKAYKRWLTEIDWTKTYNWVSDVRWQYNSVTASPCDEQDYFNEPLEFSWVTTHEKCDWYIADEWNDLAQVTLSKRVIQ